MNRAARIAASESATTQKARKKMTFADLRALMRTLRDPMACAMSFINSDGGRESLSFDIYY